MAVHYNHLSRPRLQRQAVANQQLFQYCLLACHRTYCRLHADCWQHLCKFMFLCSLGPKGQYLNTFLWIYGTETLRWSTIVVILPCSWAVGCCYWFKLSCRRQKQEGLKAAWRQSKILLYMCIVTFSDVFSNYMQMNHPKKSHFVLKGL